MNTKSFGQRLRELREAKRMSLRKLAIAIDVSAPFLSDVELGRRHPTPDRIARIAEVLEADLDDLKKYDFRNEADQIKKMMFADSAAGMAFRTVAEKIQGGVSPEEIIKQLNK